VIPFARGRSRSRAIWDIQREAIALVERGHKEIVLSGVNIGTYDFEEKRILDVIQMLETIGGLERIRISSIEPTTIPYELIDYMADSEKLCNHFHIPLQHGEDAILQKMRRLYSVREYCDFMEYVEKKVPGVCFGTDVMVGFPGEGDEEFKSMRNLLKELPLAYFHVFSFSERGGTPAVQMENKVDSKIKKQRSQNLRELSSIKKHQYFKGQIGKKTRVLMEERGKFGLYEGFTENYVKVGVETELDLENRFVDVSLNEMASEHLVFGQVLAPAF